MVHLLLTSIHLDTLGQRENCFNRLIQLLFTVPQPRVIPPLIILIPRRSLLRQLSTGPCPRSPRAVPTNARRSRLRDLPHFFPDDFPARNRGVVFLNVA